MALASRWFLIFLFFSAGTFVVYQSSSWVEASELHGRRRHQELHSTPTGSSYTETNVPPWWHHSPKEKASATLPSPFGIWPKGNAVWNDNRIVTLPPDHLSANTRRDRPMFNRPTTQTPADLLQTSQSDWYLQKQEILHARSNIMKEKLQNEVAKVTDASPKAERMLGHVHGPHMGIIHSDLAPKRPPIKGSYSVEGTFLWAVGLFGTIENGAIVMTAVFSKRFKKPLHILVGSLAVTDFFISMIYIPSYTYYLLEGVDEESIKKALESRYSGPSFCSVSHSIFVEIASVTVSIKALIAVYLYIVTTSRDRVTKIFSLRNTVCFILMAWCCNFFILFLPTFLGYSKVDFYPNGFLCRRGRFDSMTIEEEESTILYTLAALALHLAEMLVICACFLKVHRAIKQGRYYWEKNKFNDADAKINYARATKITCLIFATFCVCWLPIYIINIVDSRHTKLPEAVHHAVMDLLLFKSAINPSIYIYAVRSLRHEMKLFCLCRCRADPKKPLPFPPDSSTFEGPSESVSTCSAGV